MYYVLCDSEKPLRIMFDEHEAKFSCQGDFEYLEVFDEDGILVQNFKWIWEKIDFSEGYWTEDF